MRPKKHSFLDALFEPDLDLQPSKRVILLDAAQILEITEFEILERAWRDHFGSRFTASQEKHFYGQILLADMEVPVWAVTYAERILEENRILREQRTLERQQRMQELWQQSRRLPVLVYAGAFCMGLYLVFLLSGNQISEYIPIFQSESEHVYTSQPESQESPPDPRIKGLLE